MQRRPYQLELWEKLHLPLCCYDTEQRIIITQFVIFTNKHIRNVIIVQIFELIENCSAMPKQNIPSANLLKNL